MKLIACDVCHDVVGLREDVRSCECHNISGNYVDSTHIVVQVKNRNRCRVLGIVNSVRYGMLKRGDCFIIPWDDETITVIEPELWNK